MRMSALFLQTLRDDPADADVDSHRLLVRAGYIRKLGAGLYTWLPLGTRVLHKVAQIVREEMDRAGAQEVVMPILQPLELWQRTGRDVAYGPTMFRLEDRKETSFALAPTAEEVIATTVAGDISSYRQLPVNLYQINWKFRDELRPRFGLLRGREFLMKDAYSFDTDVEGLRASYQLMYDAYHRVFERCGLTFRPVEAQAGEIGGDVNHEFMAVAAVGEDDFVWCRSCDYAANVEAALRATDAPTGGSVDRSTEVPPMERVHTPGLPGIDGVAEFLGVAHHEMLKCIAFDVTETDGTHGLALVLVPGDREVNTFAVARELAPRRVRLFDDDDFKARPEIPRGYIGPHHPAVTDLLADHGVAAVSEWATGANEMDHHVRHAVLGRDFPVPTFANLVAVSTGDPCPRCGQPLSIDKGIEVGHTFQLGTIYSQAIGAEFTDVQGAQHPMVMGCYGIGVSRVVAAVVEEHHDEQGIRWPVALSPYDVHVVALPGKGDAAAEVIRRSEQMVDELEATGLAVLFDDRDASPGVKFADADLLGIPLQIVVGAKGLSRGVVELKERATGTRHDVVVDGVTGVALSLLNPPS